MDFNIALFPPKLLPNSLLIMLSILGESHYMFPEMLIMHPWRFGGTKTSNEL